MKEIDVNIADSFSIPLKHPNQANMVLIPSYMNGNNSVSQSGNLLTVTVPTGHNLGLASFIATFVSTDGTNSVINVASVISDNSSTNISPNVLLTGSGIPDGSSIISLGTFNGTSGTINVSGVITNLLNSSPVLVIDQKLLGYKNQIFNISVYINSNVGLIMPDFYDNLIVTSATTFTCTSTINQTVTYQPIHSVNTSYGNSGFVKPYTIDIPPGTLKAGSTLRLEAFIKYPPIKIRGLFLGHGIYYNNLSYTESNIFGTVNIPSGAMEGHYSAMVTFLDDTPNCNFLEIAYLNGVPYGLGNNKTLQYHFTSDNGQYFISPTNGFTVVPAIRFIDINSNDWVLFLTQRTEMVR